MSQFRFIGKWEKILCFVAFTVPLHARGSMGNSWKELGEHWCGEHSDPPDSPWNPVAIPENLAIVHFVIRRRLLHFYLCFRFLLIHATGFPGLLTHNFTSFCCWIFRADHSILRWTGEDEVEELVDRPGTTNGTQFAILQWILLPFLVRCGFGPLVQWQVYPWSSQSFPSERTAGVSSRSITVTNRSNSSTYTVASFLVCTSPLAVITVVGFFEILMVSNSAESRSLLLTMCILAPESTTNSLSSSSFVDAAGIIHFSVGEFSVALSFSLSLQIYVWQDFMSCRVQSLLEICPQIS